MNFNATRLCGCSFIHGQQTLAQGLDLVERLEFSWVDIGVGGTNAHFDATQVARDPTRYADEVRRETAARNLQINECFALNFGAPINAPEAATRRHTRELFRGLCEFAAGAKFQSVMLIAGPTHTAVGRESSRDLAALALGELVEIAGDYDLLLNLEADSESCVNTPEDARDLCERVPGLGLTLDLSHFVCQGIAPERLEVLYPYARHLHVRQAARGCIVAPADRGEIDFADTLQKLEICGYHGLLCIEYLSFSPDDATRRDSEQQTLTMKNNIAQLIGEANHP